MQKRSWIMNSSPKNQNDELDASSVGSLIDLPPDFAALRSQKRALLEEQRSRWEEADAASLEEVLQRWPSGPQTDPDVASVLFQDLLQRRLHGENPSLDEYSQRFPEHKLSLAGMVSHQDFLRSVGVECSARPIPLRFPEVGDELFGFRFRAEL